MHAQSIFALLALVLRITYAQAPNTLAIYNSSKRTASENSTTFIIPIRDTVARALAHPYKLLKVPVTDPTLFPSGFPADMHPLYLQSGVQSDIRIQDLEIDCLLNALIYLPFVDRLGDNKTAFSQPVGPNLVGGCNGKSARAYVPALVGSLGGTPISPAFFLPNAAAYQYLYNNTYSVDVKELIIPNSLSGPSVGPAVFDFFFSMATTPLYTAHTFHSMLNQPIILDNGLCLRNNFYFNESFAGPVFRSGQVRVYTPAKIAGVYLQAGGYSVTAENVGHSPQRCARAAQKNDPVASV